MKLLKFIVTIIFVVFILIVGILGYAGIIPGVAAIFGANKPRDLGALHTAQDLVSGQAKLQQTFVKPSGTLTVKTILNTGASTINANLTEQEWAAHVEAMHPVKNLQVKFHTDGTFEASGRVDKSRIFDTVKLLGYANISETEVLNNVEKYFPGDAVFYMKGAGEMVNDKAAVTLERFELGRLPIGKGTISGTMESYAKLMADTIPGLAVKMMEVRNGQLHFEGTAPKQVPQF